MEDLTPPAPDLAEDRREGGADRFLAFVKEELEPVLVERLPMNRSRTAIMGHSFGGLLALHALLHHPEMFETYIVGSPSIWWHDRYVLTGLPTFLKQLSEHTERPRVLVTVGALEQTPRRSAGPRGRFTVERRMVDHALELGRALEASGALEVRTLVFPGEDHYSSWLPLLSRGLFFFVAPELLPENLGSPEPGADGGERSQEAAAP